MLRRCDAGKGAKTPRRGGRSRRGPRREVGRKGRHPARHASAGDKATAGAPVAPAPRARRDSTASATSGKSESAWSSAATTATASSWATSNAEDDSDAELSVYCRRPVTLAFSSKGAPDQYVSPAAACSAEPTCLGGAATRSAARDAAADPPLAQRYLEALLSDPASPPYFDPATDAHASDFVTSSAKYFRSRPSGCLPAHECEQVLIDLNFVRDVEGVAQVAVGEIQVSPNERRVLTSLDFTNGEETFVITVYEVDTHRVIRRVNSVPTNHWVSGDARNSDKETAPRAKLGATRKRKNSREWCTRAASGAGPVSHASVVSKPRAGAGDEVSHVARPHARDAAVVHANESAKRHLLHSHDHEHEHHHIAGSAGSARLHLSPANVPPHDYVPHGCAESCVWGSDNVFFFVELELQTHRPFRVWKHDLRALPEAANYLMFEEQDPAFEVVGLWTTCDDAYIVFDTSRNQCSEVHVLPRGPAAEARDAQFRVLRPREPGVVYTVTHHRALPFAELGRTAPPHGPTVAHGRRSRSALPEAGPSGVPAWVVWHTAGCAAGLRVDVCRDDSADGAWQGASFTGNAHAPYSFVAGSERLPLLPPFNALRERGSARQTGAAALWSPPCDLESTAVAPVMVTEWHPLLVDDPLLHIDDIECKSGMLLFTVRRGGFQTVLILDLLRPDVRRAALPLSTAEHFLDAASLLGDTPRIPTCDSPAAQRVLTVETQMSDYADPCVYVACSAPHIPDREYRLFRRGGVRKALQLAVAAESSSARSWSHVFEWNTQLLMSHRVKKYKPSDYRSPLIMGRVPRRTRAYRCRQPFGTRYAARLPTPLAWWLRQLMPATRTASHQEPRRCR